MHRQDLLHGLDFQHEGLFGDDVDLQVAVDGIPFVEDRQFLLPNETDSREGKFAAKACFVDDFEQPGPEGPVHLDRAPDDFLG